MSKSVICHYTQYGYNIFDIFLYWCNQYEDIQPHSKKISDIFSDVFKHCSEISGTKQKVCGPNYIEIFLNQLKFESKKSWALLEQYKNKDKFFELYLEILKQEIYEFMNIHDEEY